MRRPPCPLTASQLTPAALLVDCDTKRSYTFAQIKDHSVAFGKGLKHALKWAKGDVLAFFSPNSIDTPIVNLGLHWAGGVASPANPTYTVDELARQLADSHAKAVVTQKPFLQATRAAAQKVGLPLDRIILMGDARDETGEHRHWTDINAKGAWVQPGKTAIDPKKDLAYLVYSSVGPRALPPWTRDANTGPRAPPASPRASCSRTTTWSPTRTSRGGSTSRRSTGTSTRRLASCLSSTSM